MPYIRKGNAVYRQDTGELVGRSSSPEMAKRYMRALYAHMKTSEKRKSIGRKKHSPLTGSETLGPDEYT